MQSVRCANSYSVLCSVKAITQKLFSDAYVISAENLSNVAWPGFSSVAKKGSLLLAVASTASHLCCAVKWTDEALFNATIDAKREKHRDSTHQTQDSFALTLSLHSPLHSSD